MKKGVRMNFLATGWYPHGRARWLRFGILAALALTLSVWLYAGSAQASQLIRHRLAVHRATTALAPTSVATTVQRLREVNYDPSVASGGGLWSWWRPAMLNADMAKIASLGANTVRVFLQPG